MLLTATQIRRARSGLSFSDLEVEHVTVEVGEDVLLEELLVTVQRELFAAHGTDLPMALHVLLELGLVVVRREDHFTQGTTLLLASGFEAEWHLSIIQKFCRFRGCRLIIVLSALRLFWFLQSIRATEVTGRLYAHDIAIPGWRPNWGQSGHLVIRELSVGSIPGVSRRVGVPEQQISGTLGHQQRRWVILSVRHWVLQEN